MTGHALLRRRLVEGHGAFIDRLRQRVAPAATHILVDSLERERGPCVVVERGRLPLLRDVTTGTRSGLRCIRELAGMRVGVTFLALRRCSAEIYIQQVRFQLRGAMTIRARHRAVRTCQRELRRRMVKTFQVFPRRNRMAGFAPGRLAVLQPGHAFAELSAVWIAVAGSAGSVVETKLGGAFERAGTRDLVTFPARDSQVRAQQRKARALVEGEGKRRGTEALDGVAGFAAVQIRRCLELTEMGIAVAVRAPRELDLEQRGFARGYVTLRARDVSMLPDQGISRAGVLLQSEYCGLESLHGVARRALPAIGSFCKLSAVRVGMVAVGALLKSNRLLEVSAHMTRVATHVRMLAQERELRRRVIEFAGKRRGRNRLPVRRVVARLAGSSE